VFDEGSVSDVSTFSKPHAYARGFVYVIVNGTITVANGKHTGARSGQILKGPGASLSY
jgi:N-acyl-D-amino-acid deacylase